MNKPLVIKLLRQLADAFEAEESGAEVERGEGPRKQQPRRKRKLTAEHYAAARRLAGGGKP